MLIGMAMISTLGFLIYSMHTGQTNFAERVVDIVIGGLGGFFFGRYMGNKKSD